MTKKCSKNELLKTDDSDSLTLQGIQKKMKLNYALIK